MQAPVEQFIDQVKEAIPAEAEAPPPDGPDGEQKPRVPFVSSLRLAREQETRLVEHAFKRLEELEAELGRSETGEADWYQAAAISDKRKVARTFMAKRQLFEMAYNNRMDWRPGVLGGIFEKSNLVVPIARRVIRQMVARANNYFFGTDPWFSAYPIGASDKPTAERVERYTRHKLDEAGTKGQLETAIEMAFVRGETVVKTTYRRREDIYKQEASVLIGADGKPMLDAGGDFIEEGDLFVPEQQAAVDPVTGQPAADPATGEPLMQPTGAMVLKRDGKTVMPATPQYQKQLITRRLTIFEGPDAQPVYFRDFLCPLDAATVQDADSVFHLYDMPVGVIADLYRRRGVLDAGANAEATAAAIRLLRDLANESGEPKAAKDQRRDELQEDDRRTERTVPVAEIAEVWLRYDADNDGIEEEIMLVLDRKNRQPIYYDYTANMTPDGQRPFDVIRASKVDNRWHGIGAMEMFESSQNIIDLLVNRWNYSQSAAGRVDFWRPYNTVEGDRDPHLKLNWGGTYTPKAGMKAEDCLETVTLPDIKHEALQNMFEFFLQMVMNESGVQHANDAQAVGMDSAKLATGIRNIEKSGQEMFALFLSSLEPGLQGVIRRMSGVLFFNLNAEEAFTFFEGDTAQIDQITPEEVRDLELNVQILMTRYRGEQVLQSSGQAAALATQFYGLPPEIQQLLAPLYRDQLKALQVSNADEIIVPGISMAGLAPGGQLASPPTPRAPGQSQPLL